MRKVVGKLHYVTKAMTKRKQRVDLFFSYYGILSIVHFIGWLI